jgi:hypothetical protein
MKRTKAAEVSRRNPIKYLAWTWLGAGLLACSSSSAPASTPSETAGDAGSGVDSSSPGDGNVFDASGSVDEASPSDGSVACNDLVNDAPPVTITTTTDPPDARVGGSIVDGTYFVTSVVIHLPADGGGAAQADGGGAAQDAGSMMAQGTIVKTGSTVQIVMRTPTGQKHLTRMATTSGNQLTRSALCPLPAMTDTIPYTATPTSFIHDEMLPDGSVKTTVHTKQ